MNLASHRRRWMHSYGQSPKPRATPPPRSPDHPRSPQTKLRSVMASDGRPVFKEERSLGGHKSDVRGYWTADLCLLTPRSSRRMVSRSRQMGRWWRPQEVMTSYFFWWRLRLAGDSILSRTRKVYVTLLRFVVSDFSFRSCVALLGLRMRRAFGCLLVTAPSLRCRAVRTEETGRTRQSTSTRRGYAICPPAGALAPAADPYCRCAY